jgi:hypothetical protein
MAVPQTYGNDDWFEDAVDAAINDWLKEEFKKQDNRAGHRYYHQEPPRQETTARQRAQAEVDRQEQRLKEELAWALNKSGWLKSKGCSGIARPTPTGCRPPSRWAGILILTGSGSKRTAFTGSRR